MARICRFAPPLGWVEPYGVLGVIIFCGSDFLKLGDQIAPPKVTWVYIKVEWFFQEYKLFTNQPSRSFSGTVIS
jgi:hypothetical protein